MAKGSSKKKSDSDDVCSNCETLAKTVTTLTESVNKLLDRVQSLESALETALSKIDQSTSVPTEQDVLSHSAVLKRVEMLEERLEERTNRQLRKTLVIRDLQQHEHERTWQDTEKVLAKEIASILSVEQGVAVGMIDRCHRGGNPEYYRKSNKVRPIFAAMHDWKTCEEIIQQARRKRTLFVDFKYGPMTTKRRNLALKKRRELLNTGQLVKAHIAYPARLMGKGKGDSKYKEIENFSNVDVRSEIFKI